MAAFTMERVGEMVWPEALGISGVVAAHIGARAMDAAYGLNQPWKRVSDWGHVVILGGAAYFYGIGKNPELAKTVFIADAALLAATFGDWLYATARGGGAGGRALNPGRAGRTLRTALSPPARQLPAGARTPRAGYEWTETRVPYLV